MAATAFNDPLHAAPGSTLLPLPSKDYPASPLALYYEQRNGRAQESVPTTPRDRYKVLLRFFATLSYASVLGGGIAAVAVALYRAYILPRLTETLSARSALLKHHHTQYGSLLEKIRLVGKQAIGGPVQAESADEPADVAPETAEEGKNGVATAVKKVTFSDEVEKDDSLKSETAAAPLADPSVEEKETKSAMKKSASSTSIPSDPSSPKKSVAGLDAEGEAVVAVEKQEQEPLKPIYLFDDLCASLTRLSTALKGELRPTDAGVRGSKAPARSRLPPNLGSKQATVFSESSADEDWESSLSASEGEGTHAEEEEDELEFDPFAPIPRRHASSKVRRRVGPSSRLGGGKHSPSPLSNSSTDAHTTRQGQGQAHASSSNPKELYSRLSNLNSYINAQSFLTSTNDMGRYNGPLGISNSSSTSTPSGYLSASASENESPFKARGTATAATATSGSGATDTSAAPTAVRATDVNQVKAEIRSLKGLLLSRRNFPSYSRPPVVQSS
ncbi:hypothetical protein CBOM_00060 [Ceraceosorus bombacis]|uniref:Uncharacterized protein n=1 Tax=Ceraceosorus bombacis TaxID=401625 RepID=A0A0P1B7Z3_9BASI|nr:hypothetical protein CBOM_00060 [Ceraceosorus bombacis]